MNDTASPKKSVTRIGTSCEQVMVGQRIKVIEDNMAEFDVSSSMDSLSSAEILFVTEVTTPYAIELL